MVGGLARAGKVVSAVCHGPNGLVNVNDANGDPIVKGREVQGGRGAAAAPPPRQAAGYRARKQERMRRCRLRGRTL